MTDVIDVPGYVYGDREPKKVAFDNVGPGYFATMRIPVIAGREFLPSDRKEQFDSAKGPWSLVVVNQAFAKRYWPDESPLGRSVLIRGRMPAQVIGVVQNAALEELDVHDRPQYFIALTQMMQPAFEVVVRTDGDPRRLLRALRAATTQLDVRVGEPRIRTLQIVREQSLLLPRVARALFSILGCLALSLAVLGTYGVTVLTITQQRREIGIRLALGARSATIYRDLFRSILVPLVIGAAAGLLLFLAALQTAQMTISGLPANQWLAMSAALSVVTVSAIVATLIPSRRAVRIAPAEAMRL